MKELVTSLGVAVILELILQQKVMPRGCPGEGATLHFDLKLVVIRVPVVVEFFIFMMLHLYVRSSNVSEASYSFE